MHRFRLVYLVLWQCFWAAPSLFAQYSLSGKVMDAKSISPLAFVTVIVNDARNGTYTDIDGNFNVQSSEPIYQLKLSYVGYKPLTMKVAGEKVLSVYLEQAVVEIGTATVFSGENPAERIVRLAIENKKDNNPERGVGFTYDSYNKLIFTADIDSSLLNNPEKIMALDTSDQKAIDFFDKQHIFLMESVSERSFIPPALSQENVKASRVSGLKNPDFALLGTQLQSFSFYSEQINVLDMMFLSPLSYGAINKYLYTIEDTTYQDADTVFVLSYQPRSGKNFDGLKGLLYINTQGYAIQNVIAEPAESKDLSFNIRIQQQYEFVQKRKWFPVQLNTFIFFNTVSMNNFRLMGVGRSYIKNIQLDPPLKRRDFGHVTLKLEDDAHQQSEEFWNQHRINPLDEKELKTYHVIDSIGKAENLDSKLLIFQSLASGKIPMGKLEFDLNRLMSFNDYEGFRLGAGLHTSSRFSNVWKTGAYVAYGFQDKAWKYGADSKLMFDRKREVYLEAKFEKDVVEFGTQKFVSDGSFLAPAEQYKLFINRMENYERYGAHVGFRSLGYFTWRLSAEKERRLAFGDYQYATTVDENLRLLDRDFDLELLSAELRFAYKEKFIESLTRRLAVETPYPVLELKYTRALTVDNAEYEFDRWDARIGHSVRLKNLGIFKWRITAGMVSGDAPGGYLFNLKGVFRNFGIFSPYSFATMRTNEFLADEFATLHLYHDFGNLLFKTKKFKPEFLLGYNAAIGRFNSASRHEGILYTVPEKLYSEAGLQINKLVKSGFTALGVGVFYRMGEYAFDKPSDNLAFQLTLGMNF
jgi:hypothetical protein